MGERFTHERESRDSAKESRMKERGAPLMNESGVAHCCTQRESRMKERVTNARERGSNIDWVAHYYAQRESQRAEKVTKERELFLLTSEEEKSRMQR